MLARQVLYSMSQFKVFFASIGFWIGSCVFALGWSPTYASCLAGGLVVPLHAGLMCLLFLGVLQEFLFYSRYSTEFLLIMCLEMCSMSFFFFWTYEF
jgi:hypothetical protein